jgi:hypothetical protein
MILRFKKSPKAWPNYIIFGPQLIHYAFCGKNWSTSVIFKEILPEVDTRPIGENSPDPVTLLPTEQDKCVFSQINVVVTRALDSCRMSGVGGKG